MGKLRVLPRARQLDVLLNRIDDATRRLDDAHRRFTDFERTHTRHRQGLFQTITNLSNCAERAQRRIQAIMHALKDRDKETRAIEALARPTFLRLRARRFFKHPMAFSTFDSHVLAAAFYRSRGPRPSVDGVAERNDCATLWPGTCSQGLRRCEKVLQERFNGQ